MFSRISCAALAVAKTVAASVRNLTGRFSATMMIWNHYDEHVTMEEK